MAQDITVILNCPYTFSDTHTTIVNDNYNYNYI